jgi:hypothetical protein
MLTSARRCRVAGHTRGRGRGRGRVESVRGTRAGTRELLSWSGLPHPTHKCVHSRRLMNARGARGRGL